MKQWYDKELENVNRFVYLGWIIVRKRRNCDDEQALKQAGKFFAAAHETSQAYKFTRHLPWQERVNFAKTFGSVYAPEAFTSISQKALSKLKAAHRYLYMRLTGWNGEECYDEEESARSISIRSEDSEEEYYDTRSRWLYAYAAGAERTVFYNRVQKSSTECSFIASMTTGTRMTVVHLKPAPDVQFQMRQARFRIAGTIKRIGFRLVMDDLLLSKCVKSAVEPYEPTGAPVSSFQC